MTEIPKLARLADIFLDAADFPLASAKDKMGMQVESMLSADEKKIVENELFNAIFAKSNGDTKIEKETLALADVFCRAAARTGLEKQAAKLIPLAQTDRKTEKELANAGYAHFSRVVALARKMAGMR